MIGELGRRSEKLAKSKPAVHLKKLDLAQRTSAMSSIQLLERNAPKVSYPPHASEISALEYMSAQGLYCEHGRNTLWRYVDIVVWGGVLVEVKESTFDEKRGRYMFRLRSNRKKKQVRGHLFVLRCIKDGIATHHVFPINHPVFYNKDGEMKRGITYIPNPKGKRRKQYGDILTLDLMSQQQDAWHYVETELLALRKRQQAKYAYALPKAA